MPEKYRNFLNECFDYYNKTGDRVLKFDKYNDKDNWKNVQECLDYLIETGYFKKFRKDLRLYIVEFTPWGLSQLTN